MVLVDFEDLDDGHDKYQTQHGEWRLEKKTQSWGWSSTEWSSHQARQTGLGEYPETAASLFCGSAITKLQGKPNMHMNDGAGRVDLFIKKGLLEFLNCPFTSRAYSQKKRSSPCHSIDQGLWGAGDTYSSPWVFSPTRSSPQGCSLQQ